MPEQLIQPEPVEPAKDIAGVSMLAAFKASGEPGQEVLQYDNLPKKAGEALNKEYPLINQFWEAKTDTLDEEKKARSLAMGYLVLNGQKLREIPEDEQSLWSGRFTTASVELYGAPDQNLAHNLLSEQHDTFAKLRGAPGVDQEMLGSFLRKIDTPPSSETTVSMELISPEDVAAFGDQVWRQHGTVLNALTPEHLGLNGKVTPETAQQVFSERLAVMQSEDSLWDGWTSKVVDGEGMSTSVKDKVLKIGNRGNYTAERLMPLFAHEALVHGYRGMWGDSLPGNLDAEEGIGLLTEYALTGVMADRHIDRYIDVALALGSPQKQPLSRTELHELHTQRLMLRKQAAGQSPDYDEVSRSAWNHIDRIYRGSLGNEQIGVNTKDIAYYQGFAKIAQYITSERAAGKSMESIYAYIMQGPFDPTDARHRQAMAAKSNLLY